MRLWLDDIRPMPEGYHWHARTVAEALQIVADYATRRGLRHRTAFGAKGVGGPIDITTHPVWFGVLLDERNGLRYTLVRRTNQPREKTMQIEKRGRRYYIRGNTYPIKDQLRSAGCRWDRDEKAWWTGKADVADRFASVRPESGRSERPERPAPGLDATVAGRARYKGRVYYLVGRASAYGEVEPVQTRDGAKMLLAFRDGSKDFWAAADVVETLKLYQRPKTIRSLRDYAEMARAGAPVDRDHEYCYHTCPVGHFKCSPENGPCHDCQ